MGKRYDQLDLDDRIALILIAKSAMHVIKLAIQLGNPGSMTFGIMPFGMLTQP